MINTPIIVIAPPISCAEVSVSPINVMAKIEAKTGIRFKNGEAFPGPRSATALFQLRNATIDANIPIYKKPRIEVKVMVIGLLTTHSYTAKGASTKIPMIMVTRKEPAAGNLPVFFFMITE